MDDDEKTELPEMDVDVDVEKKARRSSILKPQKPRNPLSTLDFSESNPDNTLARATRRVSFASSNFVKPFAADPEKNTIWDNTYEEEVNHTDSTKSSCDQTHGTKTSDFLNMSSIYSASTELYHNEKVSLDLCSLTTQCININTDKVVGTVNKVVNPEESLISIARKLRSRSASEHHGNSETKDFTVLNNKTSYTEKSYTITPTSNVNVKLQEYIPEICTINKTKDITCSRNISSVNTIDITARITDKENVNPLINDLSLILPKGNGCDAAVTTKQSIGENCEFTKLLQGSEKTVYFNKLESDLEFTGLDITTENSKRYKNTNLNKCNSTMEFTCFSSEDNMNYTTKEDKEELCKIDIEKIPVRDKQGSTKDSTTYFDNSRNVLEFTSVEENERHYTDEFTTNKSKRKTIIFNETEGNMDFTIIDNSSSLNTNENIDCGKAIQGVSVLENPKSELDRKNKTIIFNQLENDMEFTTTLPIKIQSNVEQNYVQPHQIQNVPMPIRKEETVCFNNSGREMITNTIPIQRDGIKEMKIGTDLKRTICFDKSESNMEFTNTFPIQRDIIKERNICTDLKQTICFDNSGSNMEFTNTFPIQRDTIKERNICTDLKQTICFDNSGSNMEFTNTFPIQSDVITEKITDTDLKQTIFFDKSACNMEFTNTFPIQTDTIKEAKIGTDLKETICFENLECNMEFTTLAGKIDSLVNATALNQEQDMELTTVLPTTENKITELGEHKTMFEYELTSTLPNTLKQCDMSFTQNLQIRDFGSDMPIITLNNISSKLDSKKSNCDLNIVKIKDMVVNETDEVNTSCARLILDPVRHANLCVSDMNATSSNSLLTLKTNKATSNSSSYINVTELQEKMTEDKPLFVSGSTPSIIESIQQNKYCSNNVYNEVNNTNIDTSKIITDTKRHMFNCTEGDIIKKRRIEQSPSQNEKSDLGNKLDSEFSVSKHSGSDFREKPYAGADKTGSVIGGNDTVPGLVGNLTSIQSNISNTNLKTSLQTSALSNSNILYSEPMKIKLKTPKFIAVPDLSTNHNLQNVDGTVNLDHISTPATSFHINLSTMSPCIEDTQQLIHATFSKPETLVILSNDKDAEASFNVLDKDTIPTKPENKNLFEDCTKLPHSEVGKETNIQQGLDETASENLPKINKKTFIKENFKTLNNIKNVHKCEIVPDISSEKLDNDFAKMCNESIKKNKSCFIDDITPLALVPPEEFDDLSLNIKSPNQSGGDKKLTPENIEASEQTDSLTNNSDDEFANYTMRSQFLISNIEKYLSRLLVYEPEEQSNDFMLAKEIKENSCIINNYLCKLKKHKFDLEEKHRQDMEERQNSVNGITVSTEYDSGTSSTFGVIAPKTLQERVVCEISKRTKKYWKFLKMEDGYYYFHTLFETLPFRVHVHPELGMVYSVETYSNLSDIVQPVCWYLFKLLQQKLRQENLFSVLGEKFDIFTLLDYIYISMDEIINFHREYTSLVKKYGETHHFRMNPDYSVTFEILNVKLIICWIITVKLSVANLVSVTKEDITAVYTVGQRVNEEHIKTIAENTPKGHNFLRNFLEHVEEYAKRIGRRTKR